MEEDEDIKILETQIQACKECKFATCEQCEISWTEVQALQNLIARYKELEEDIKYVSEEKWKADETVIFLTERLENALKDRIPKSKVQEKIEELKKEKKAPITIQWEMEDMIEAKIQVLQELLED